MCGLREPAAAEVILACLDPQPEADYRGCRWIEATRRRCVLACSVALRRCRAAHGVPSIARSSGPTGEPRAGPRQHERVSASPTDLGRTAVPVGARGHGLGCADAAGWMSFSGSCETSPRGWYYQLSLPSAAALRA